MSDEGIQGVEWSSLEVPNHWIAPRYRNLKQVQVGQYKWSRASLDEMIRLPKRNISVGTDHGIYFIYLVIQKNITYGHQLSTVYLFGTTSLRLTWERI